MAEPTGTMEQGVFVVAEFIDNRPGRAWTGRDGETRRPQDVTVLLGRSSVRIQYRSVSDAMAALHGAVKGDVVALRVFPTANKDRVFYSGISARAVGE